MRFIVENFGPIERADIEIRDLNVFIGKNSTGKSYLAYLIWALLSVEPDWRKLTEIIERTLPRELLQEALSKDEDLHRRLKNREEQSFKDYIQELHEINEKISDRIRNLVLEVFKKFDDVWGRNLETLLKDLFLVDDLSELVRKDKDRAKIIVCDNSCLHRITIEIANGNLLSKIEDETIREVDENLTLAVVSGKPFYLTVFYNENEYDLFFTAENYIPELTTLIPTIFLWVFDGYLPFASTFIAPDGRAGLVRSREAYLHRALLSKMPAMNEVDRHFMGFLESLPPTQKNEKIAKLAEFLEKELGLRYILQRELPRYIVSIGDIQMPIQRAPSGYRELAPLIYAMRYGLDEGWVVTIEEPEAHLHPDAQIVVVRTLAGLSKFVCVIMTTHSITVLDELNSLLKLKRLSNDEKRELGYEEWEGLDPQNLAIYIFTSDGEVEKLEVHEDGIEETELDRVIIEIANKHARVSEYYERSRRLHT